MDVHPKHPTGNIGCLVNFQAQYLYPSNIHPTWFDKYGITRKMEARNLDKIGDSSRKIAYALVEKYLDNHGRNGKECMLRSICEVAETPLSHNGLSGELLHIFFT